MLNTGTRFKWKTRPAHVTDYLATMDVDEDTNQNPRGSTRGIPTPVLLVDNNHPFDLEAYSSSYTGITISKHPKPTIDNGEQGGRPWIVSCTSSPYVLYWRSQLYSLLYSISSRPETSISIGTVLVPTMRWPPTRNSPLRQKSRLWIKRGTMNGHRRIFLRGRGSRWN